MIVVNPESLKASFSRIISLLLRAVPEPTLKCLGLKKRRKDPMEFFKNFDQNSSQKTENLKI